MYVKWRNISQIFVTRVINLMRGLSKWKLRNYFLFNKFLLLVGCFPSTGLLIGMKSLVTIRKWNYIRLILVLRWIRGGKIVILIFIFN